MALVPADDIELEDGEIEDDDDDYDDKEKEENENEDEEEINRDRIELESEEEKKRKLEERIHALERQMAREGEDYIDDDEDDAAEDEDEVKLEDLDRRESSVRSSKRSSSRRSHKSSRRKHENEADGQPRRKRQKKGNNNAAAEDTRGRSHRKNGDPQRSPNRDAKEVCKLFMQGKCPKSPTSCLYSHDADPPKIMELCKFYLFERCAKRDKCLYLHKGFPCKYYHTGTRCLDTAETCKFSHEPLTEELRIILLKHLESAPKEILGDFPRMTREYALALVTKTEAKHKGLEEGIPEADQEKAEADKPQSARKKKSRWSDEPAQITLPPPALMTISSPSAPIYSHDQPDEADGEKNVQEKIRRDPRLRTQFEEAPAGNDVLDMDLGAVFGDLELPPVSGSLDARDSPIRLAKEVDAYPGYSHPPIVYQLCGIVTSKADYKSILNSKSIPRSQIQLDPRLRKYQQEQPHSTSHRRDPRRRD